MSLNRTETRHSAKPYWNSDGLYILDGSIVGTVTLTASGEYAAHGCMSDWQDVDLGTRVERLDARELVKQWVKENR